MTDDEIYAQIQLQVQQKIELAAKEYLSAVLIAIDNKTAIKIASDKFNAELIKVITWGMKETALLTNQAENVSVYTVKRYRMGPTTLSRALYNNVRQVEQNAINTINEHAKYFQSARKLALQLYEGYEFNPNEVLQIKFPRLPIYMNDAALTRDVNSLLHKIAQTRANGLKTDALRASYLRVLDDIKAGKGQTVLERAVKVAIEEKSRYYGKRIAQTELHRIRNKQKAKQIINDDDLLYVQIMLSRSHPKPDMCDIFAKQNRHGLGDGIYPKDAAPSPPFHPFCKCYIRPRFDMIDEEHTEENQQSASVLLNGMNYSDAVQIAGSIDGLKQIQRGRDYNEIYNERQKYKEYKLKSLGDMARMQIQ